MRLFFSNLPKLCVYFSSVIVTIFYRIKWNLCGDLQLKLPFLFSSHTLDSSTHSDQDLPISQPPAIRAVELHTNPETWGPRETAIFLSQTSDCSQLSDLVIKDAVDGPTFLMLNYSIAREYWNLDESMAIQLCQHVESVRQAHLLQFLWVYQQGTTFIDQFWWLEKLTFKQLVFIIF